MRAALVQRFIAADGFFNAVRQVPRKLAVQQQHVAEHIALQVFHALARQFKAFCHGDDGVALTAYVAFAHEGIDLVK